MAIGVVLYRYSFPAYVREYTSIAILAPFSGGGQLLTVGMIGEDPGRMFQQVKARPPFVVDELIGFP